MAACPYLLLEEQGTSPFPFPSVSHRCYVTGTGLPVRQREQRRYCLSKHYTLCPFFPFQSAEATVLDTIPESVAGERAAIPAQEPLRLPPTVADTAREPPSLPVKEALPQETAYQRPPEPAAARKLEPPLAADDLSSTSLDLEPGVQALKVPAAQEAGPATGGSRRAIQVPRRALISVAMAGMCMVVLCLGTVIIHGVARLTTTGVISLASLDPLPMVLLFLSVASFAVVLLLVALLFWVRRPAA